MQELDYAGIGMRIRAARKSKGWSQDKVAAECGISLSFMGHIERGSRIMSMETFANICGALEAGADELLWGVAGPSDAVLDMWNQPVRNCGRESGKKRDDGKQNRNLADGEGGRDSYAMYVKIMKSVAEIMNEAEK